MLTRGMRGPQAELAHLRWTRDRSPVNLDEFAHYQGRTNIVYVKAGRQFSVRS